MSIIFIAHNIKTEKQLLILKEEIENELNKISESFSLHKKELADYFSIYFGFQLDSYLLIILIFLMKF